MHAFETFDGTFKLADVSEIHVDDTYGFYIYTTYEGSRIEVGSDGFEEKLRSLDKVIDARGGTLAGVTNIDLNNKRGVIVRLAAGNAQEGGVT